MDKFDSLSGKIPMTPLYFRSKQHTSLEGEPRDYNTNFNSKCDYKLNFESSKGVPQKFESR